MRIDLHDSPYLGNTSRPGARIANIEPACTRCGTQLGGRLEAVRKEPGWTLFVWRCGCGRRRRLRREVAAG
jgi:hypothetical protein